MKFSKLSAMTRVGLLSTAIAFTLTANADLSSNSIDYADVIDVQPIVKTIEHRLPAEVCWTERVRHERHHPGRQQQSFTGTVVGGVIGGALGHAVGNKKRNKQVGAAVGALLGATLGRDATRSRGQGHIQSYYTHEKRCETRYDTEYHRETVGYWVTYDYLGHQHKTRMKRDPGDRIRVRVKVEPLQG